MSPNEIILEKIKNLASQGKISYSEHAVKQMLARRMSFDKVADILVNPERLIRVDNTPLGPAYKIQGGKFRRKLAVGVQKDVLVVITVM